MSGCNGGGVDAAVPEPVETSETSDGAGRGRTGIGFCRLCPVKVGARLVALVMAAFNTWAKVGLMPHARQGGRGVCALAVAGSKLDGTGLENVHMVQTHVAE